MSTPSAPRRQLRAVQYPGSGRVHLVKSYDPATASGTLLVEALINVANIARVVGCMKGEGEASTLPASLLPNAPLPDGDCFDMPGVESPQGPTFRNPAAPVNNLPSQLPALGAAPAPTDPPPANKRVYVQAHDQAGGLLHQDSTPFLAMPPEILVTVSARHCIWLVNAPLASPPVQQFNEQPTLEYVPRPLYLPDEASFVRVEVAPGTWSWRHNPGAATASGPDGRPGTERHLEAAHAAKYRNATLQSDHIISASCRLNRLVALWHYDDPAIDTTEIDILTSPTQAVPNTRPFSLRLACHDGYEWSNNSGEVQVKVFWLEAAPPPAPTTLA